MFRRCPPVSVYILTVHTYILTVHTWYVRHAVSISFKSGYITLWSSHNSYNGNISLLRDTDSCSEANHCRRAAAWKPRLPWVILVCWLYSRNIYKRGRPCRSSNGHESNALAVTRLLSKESRFFILLITKARQLRVYTFDAASQWGKKELKSPRDKNARREPSWGRTCYVTPDLSYGYMRDGGR